MPTPPFQERKTGDMDGINMRREEMGGTEREGEKRREGKGMGIRERKGKRGKKGMGKKDYSVSHNFLHPEKIQWQCTLKKNFSNG